MLKAIPEYIDLILKYPHIARNINLFWGTKELDVYLLSLFLDTRDGTRSGFPLDTAKDLYTLWKIHDESFPHLKQTVDPWISNQLR